ncbi:MAG: YdhK family protein [Carnobacterium sp.]|uniref:YdhK family protein n=1 Tax=unclassified Carnobacterium TaxID=257487 RepID=UPI0019140872|nr:YdhK family protein [Carnobacterium sp. CS13]QQP69805.1 YdhK family protein [Carnobacterium sp. CS13]
MKKRKFLMGLVTLTTLTVLSACSSGDNNENSSSESSIDSIIPSVSSEMSDADMESMESMEHEDSGEIPDGLKEAENPKYKVGDKAIIETTHMAGMKDAEATIVGAFDTTAYEVTYTPTNGGERVENHKWVVQEEIADAGQEMLEPGTEVELEANHMEGMKGATATIEDAEQTTVYMIDYMPKNGGKEVKNHKWVTESELSEK